MQTTVDVSALQHKGKLLVSIQEDALCFTPARAIPVRFDREHLWDTTAALVLPGTYALPVRIDMEVKLDAPGFYLFFGKGRVNFATEWDDNRRITDIMEPTLKTRDYHNHVPLNEWAHLSVYYGSDGMAIWINGEARYASTREKYMRSADWEACNAEGFAAQIATAKGTHACVRNLCVTEDPPPVGPGALYVPSMPPLGNLPGIKDRKPSFEECVAQLPEDVRQRVMDMDAYLRALRPVRFRRDIEKHGNRISYVASAQGFSYGVYPSNDYMHHTLQWYHLTQGRPQTWHIKENRLIEVLEAVDRTDPARADRLFARLTDCVACRPRCIVPRPYVFKGRKAVACHGKLWLTQRAEDFADARALIATLNDMHRAGEA